VTHVLLPVNALLRRADTAAVIVSALAAKARCGFGFRRIAADLGRPGETVRGWLRRFAERAEAVRSMFTVWLRATPEEHMQRVIAQGDMRPMADNDESMSDLKRILAVREPLYSMADTVVDTSSHALNESLTTLMDAVGTQAL